MIVKEVTLDGSSKSVAVLTGAPHTYCSEILIQAPKTNTADIYFGSLGYEKAFVVPGGSAGLGISSINNMYIKGTATDKVIIIIVEA